MDKIIAACGITCSECPAFIATKNNDEALRGKTAAEWSKMFSVTISAEDVYCDGCMEEGEKYFAHCSDCEIRQCTMEHTIPNCAYCDDYVCEKLQGLFDMVPPAKAELDSIQMTLKE